jgi:signal transduction histidine kinase
MRYTGEGRRKKFAEMLWDNTLAAVMVVDPATHTIVDINGKGLQLIGRTREEVVGSVCHRFVCAAEAGKCPITDLGRTVDQSERYLRGVGGRRVPILKSVQEIVVDGRPLLLESFVNISTLKQTERDLLESRQLMQSVVDGIGDPVLVIDPTDYRVILANRTLIAEHGGDPVALGQRCFEVTHGADRPCDQGHGDCPLHTVIATGRPARATHCHHTGRGTTHVDVLASPVFDAAGRLVRVVESCRDMTLHRQAEEERAQLARSLLQAQKMESIGTLASGIAHDFNNILLATIGFSDAAAEKLPPGHPARAELEAVVTASERGADLVRQILAFGRQQDLQMRSVDLNELVEATRHLLSRILPRNIVTEVLLGNRIPSVLADPIQIEQVLMNLAVNARDAMAGGGTLTISTEPVGMTDLSITAPLGLTPGLYALLRVRDTGTGIPPEIRERIFEPFFTTKAEGKGTGLGLSTVYGIVAQHGGTIGVDSDGAHGTVFTIWLPAFEGTEADAPLPRGEETVLLVEDEAPTRRVIARTLENLGYTVLEAAGEEESVRLLAAHAGEIRLVLCDMLLVGAYGRDVVARLRERDRELKVLFVSGHTREYLEQRGLLAAADSLVGKASGQGGIARAVRAVLDGATLP